MIKILPHRGIRVPSLRAFALLGSAFLVFSGGDLAAQITKVLQPAVVVRNARLVTMDGKIIENGTIVCQGGRITAIGASPELPLLKRVIDATGKTITPGFVDVASALGRSKSAPSGNALLQAEDAFDRYAVHPLREALRNGVTSAYVSVGAGTGIRGHGAVVRLEPQRGGGIGSLLASRAALEIDLGSSFSPLARIGVFEAVHRQLREARKYRESLEIYEDELEEYKKKLAERATSKKKEGGAQDKKETGTERPKRTADFAAPGKQAPKPSQSPKKKDDGPKKPRKPRRDLAAERILDALDRELPVRITANKSADILNALDLAKEFDLKVILEGASEAHLLAPAIPSGMTIVLSDVARPAVPSAERTSPRNGTVLRSTGSHLRVVVGSGARSPLDARFVAFLAQLDAAPGGKGGQDGLLSDPLEVLQRVTSIAAETLGVGGEIGKLRKGMRADFVIWSGDPLDPASQVEKVFVGGGEAYDADEEGTE